MSLKVAVSSSGQSLEATVDPRFGRRPYLHACIDQPAIISMPNISNTRMKKEAERIVDYHVENIDKFCTELTNGKIPVC